MLRFSSHNKKKSFVILKSCETDINMFMPFNKLDLVKDNFNELPNNIEAEQAVIGSILVSNDIFDEVSPIINHSTFYDPIHQKIFLAIENLISKGMLANPITLKNYFENDKNLVELEGHEYLVKITKFSTSLRQAIEYSKIIYDMYVRRELIKISETTIDSASNKNIDLPGDKIIEDSEKLLFDLAERGSFRKTFIKFDIALSQTIEMAKSAHQNIEGIVGVPTGLTDLDDRLGGLHNQDLVIIAGRPSMGKTSFAFNIAENIVQKTDLTVLIFSMEMSSEQVVRRFISSIANIDLQRLLRGKLQEEDWEGVDKALTILSKKNILVDDTPALSPTELRSRSRRVKRENKDLAMIIVDYIGLMQVHNRSDNRVAEISEISRSLKALAKELEVPVVALSQLNRAVESRPNKRPLLSDLRDSGAIEQDADVIAFLYRHEQYDPQDLESKGKAEINIAKQRNGPVGTIALAFRDSVTRFENLAFEDRSPPQFYEENEDN